MMLVRQENLSKIIVIKNWGISKIIHCVTSVQIRIRKNFVFGHFPRIDMKQEVGINVDKRVMTYRYRK